MERVLAQTQSTGAWAIPVHGIFAAYPLVCFTGALVTDIAYADTANMQWANFSVWLIAAGVVMGVVAAIAGLVDAAFTRGDRRPRTWHSVLTIVMLIVALINGFIHSRDAWTSVVPTGLVLSVVTAILALVTSWVGYSAAAPAR